MKTIALAFLCVLNTLAQTGTEVNISGSAPLTAWSRLLYYSGSNLIYICSARSTQPTSTFARSDSSLTSIVVSSNTATATTASAHGLAVNDKIVVSGATVDGDLNGTYTILTTATTTTFTFTTASVANATYTESTLKFTTTAPRDTLPIWSIEKLTYSGSSATQIQWANGSTGASFICSNRASLPYN